MILSLVCFLCIFFPALHLLCLCAVLFLYVVWQRQCSSSANIFFGILSFSLWQCCIECRLRKSTYWIIFNGRRFFFSLSLFLHIRGFMLLYTAGCTIWTSCEHCFNFDVTETSYAFGRISTTGNHSKSNDAEQNARTLTHTHTPGLKQKEMNENANEREVIRANTKRILFANLSNLQEFAFSCVFFFLLFCVAYAVVPTSLRLFHGSSVYGCRIGFSLCIHFFGHSDFNDRT